MSTGLIVFIVIVAVVILLSISGRKPIVLEGRVIEMDIAKNSNDDSFITIETSTKEKIILKFDTHSVSLLIQIGGESFHDNAEELAKAISINDVVSVESYDESGTTRGVHKLLSVSTAHKESNK